MRGLSEKFKRDLKDGFLKPILEQVKGDRSLCMEIRRDSVNIYYRGGSLVRLTAKNGTYEAHFDSQYFGKTPAAKTPTFTNDILTSDAEVSRWLKSLPGCRRAMDSWFGTHPKEEREVQQMIVRDNNFGSISRSTDYFICDIEYDANANGRFDMVAVHWPSSPAARKNTKDRRLVLIEVKHGDGALDGPSGLHGHIAGVDAFLDNPGNVETLKKEMTASFNDKRALGIMNCELGLTGFSKEKPVLLLVLANHDPDKTKLGVVLRSLPACQHAEVRFASATFMGYGLFDRAILTLPELATRFSGCIKGLSQDVL
jgi:hypothetical protein